jgi:hypothetical protein
MDNDNYTKLIEFLGKKFENIDNRFEDVTRQNGILHEETQHKLELLGEGMKSQDESRERDKNELLKAIGRLEKNDMLLHSDITDHERRITQLEKKA